MCPLFLNRHVLKYILGRKIGWHDLAFFDPVMYERLRQLVPDSQKKDDSLLFTRYEVMCANEPRIGKCGVITEFMRILCFLLLFSLSCVPYVVSFSGLSFLIASSVFPNVYLLSSVSIPLLVDY